MIQEEWKFYFKGETSFRNATLFYGARMNEYEGDLYSNLCPQIYRIFPSEEEEYVVYCNVDAEAMLPSDLEDLAVGGCYKIENEYADIVWECE